MCQKPDPSVMPRWNRLSCPDDRFVLLRAGATATDAGITLANGAGPKEPAPRVKVADPSTD